MTDDEALTLRPGELVVWATHERRPTAKVEEVGESAIGTPCLRVRRLGPNKIGKPFASFWIWPHQAIRVSAGTANVYADYLEDHDEPRAAAKLREAFPIVPKEGD